eukprot:GHVH01007539.1.p1 GENE.GHVH01007539.1~~GHVH01007539.1.p1  ORF type:complete len:1527 (-),score=279.53 GHVH01007539.1:475-4848(-)
MDSPISSSIMDDDEASLSSGEESDTPPRRSSRRSERLAKRKPTDRSEEYSRGEISPSRHAMVRSSVLSSHESDGETDSDDGSVIVEAPPAGEEVLKVDDDAVLPLYNVLLPRIDKVLAWRTDGRWSQEKPWPAGEDGIEYLISWCDRSLLWSSWVLYEDVIELDVAGAKKIDNFKKIQVNRAQLSLTDDERERILVDSEQTIAALGNCLVCDRVLTHDLWRMTPWEEVLYRCHPMEALRKWRTEWRDGDSIPAELCNVEEDAIKDVVLVKWFNTPYAECTWELEMDIVSGSLDTSDLSGLLSEPMETLLVKGLVEFDRRAKRVRGDESADHPLNKHSLCDTDFAPYTMTPPFLHVPVDREGKGLHLRDYQLKGINWIISNLKKGNSLLLADEMGLGKTVQVIASMGHTWYHELIGMPSLVIVPQTTIDNWGDEFRKWLPDVNVVLYHGNTLSRRVLHRYELASVESLPQSPLARSRVVNTGSGHRRSMMNLFPQNGFADSNRVRFQFDVVVATPSIFTGNEVDFEWFKEIQWYSIIIDEAHQLKNHLSRRYQAVQQLKSRYRIFLSGTPLHNNITELFNLMHLLNPHKPPWDNRKVFEDKFSLIEDASVTGEKKQMLIQQVTSQLDLVMLRRVKRDVLGEVAPKEERILRVELSPEQKQMYQSIILGNFAELSAKKGGAKSRLQNMVMELKKVCNHPYLSFPPDDRESKLKNIANSSGKLSLLDELLPRLKAMGSRVLIFSQMVCMLKIISEFLSLRGYRHQELNGTMSKENRKKAMDAFNAPESLEFCFLLSTRAGGLGINLTAADVVIIFDSDWNPQNDLQAEARAHRLGQKKIVKIYRLICADSIEESVLERARKKLILDSLVVQGLNKGGSHRKGDDNTITGLSSVELNKIMRFGANRLFESSNNKGASEGEVKVDLDAVLDAADIQAKKDAQNEESGGEAARLLASFANITDYSFKAKKQEEDEEEEVERGGALQSGGATTANGRVGEVLEEDDDDFWTRVVPPEALAEIRLQNELEHQRVINAPRARRNQSSVNVPSSMGEVDCKASRGHRRGQDDLKLALKLLMMFGALHLHAGKDEEKRIMRESIWLRAIRRHAVSSSWTLEDADELVGTVMATVKDRTRDGGDNRLFGIKCIEIQERWLSFQVLQVYCYLDTDHTSDRISVESNATHHTAKMSGRRIDLPIEFWQKGKRGVSKQDWGDASWDHRNDCVLLLSILLEGLTDWKERYQNPKYTPYLTCLSALTFSKIRSRALRLMKELHSFRKLQKAKRLAAQSMPPKPKKISKERLRMKRREDKSTTRDVGGGEKVTERARKRRVRSVSSAHPVPPHPPTTTTASSAVSSTRRDSPQPTLRANSADLRQGTAKYKNANPSMEGNAKGTSSGIPIRKRRRKVKSVLSLPAPAELSNDKRDIKETHERDHSEGERKSAQDGSKTTQQKACEEGSCSPMSDD